MDLTEFGSAIKQGAVTKKIKEDLASGARSGVDGTPSFFINGTRPDGETDYDSLRAALQRAVIHK